MDDAAIHGGAWELELGTFSGRHRLQVLSKVRGRQASEVCRHSGLGLPRAATRQQANQQTHKGFSKGRHQQNRDPPQLPNS